MKPNLSGRDHNPRKCAQCGTIPCGPVRKLVRRLLTCQTRANGENVGGLNGGDR